MKNQIILISRIYVSSKEEFDYYTDDEDEVAILRENDRTKLLLLKGVEYYKFSKGRAAFENDELYEQALNRFKEDEAGRILTEALKRGLDKSSETIIAYHDKVTEEQNHEDEFKKIIESEGWLNAKSISYSSGGNEENNPLYRDILIPLGSAIKKKDNAETSKLIEKLWFYFAFDPILEAKLELLQNILNGDLAKPLDVRITTDKTLNDIQKKYDDFRKIDQVKNYEVFSIEYQNAFAELRDSLNLG